MNNNSKVLINQFKPIDNNYQKPKKNLNHSPELLNLLFPGAFKPKKQNHSPELFKPII